MRQDDIFNDYEGNHWFERNKAALTPLRKDVITQIIQELKIYPKTIIEVGCSNGWRLEKLRKIYNAKCYGIDISKDAVDFGKKDFPELTLNCIGLNDLKMDQEFEMVICNFVLHWIDRKNILNVIANIDKLISPGGYLVLGDFLPDFNQKRRYHHLMDKYVYTYKQDYADTFKASGLYQELFRETYNHDTGDRTGFILSGERAGCAVLRKMKNNEYYFEVK